MVMLIADNLLFLQPMFIPRLPAGFAKGLPSPHQNVAEATYGTESHKNKFYLMAGDLCRRKERIGHGGLLV